jgi:hypothetical protein
MWDEVPLGTCCRTLGEQVGNLIGIWWEQTGNNKIQHPTLPTPTPKGLLDVFCNPSLVEKN